MLVRFVWVRFNVLYGFLLLCSMLWIGWLSCLCSVFSFLIVGGVFRYLMIFSGVLVVFSDLINVSVLWDFEYWGLW